MRLDVPHYTQTMDFSCGPACVVMALKYFNFISEMNRDLEVELWRETSSIEMYGAGRYGVSAPLAVRGLNVHIITDNPGLGLIERSKTYVKSLKGSIPYLEFFYDMQKRTCSLNGTTQEIKKPTLQDIREGLQSDRVLFALVSTIIFEEEDEDIPHWIVITGEENGILTVNNPIDDDENKAHRPIYFEDLYTNVEPYQETTLISVGTKSLNKELVPEPSLPTKYLENTG
ncbi:MAG: peptidase C39 family protein [Candidatus Poseidoniia archaeon]|nr:peptidase C39 family protein [Candidatus Poseidoniia archaeon]